MFPPCISFPFFIFLICFSYSCQKSGVCLNEWSTILIRNLLFLLPSTWLGQGEPRQGIFWEPHRNFSLVKIFCFEEPGVWSPLFIQMCCYTFGYHPSGSQDLLFHSVSLQAHVFRSLASLFLFVPMDVHLFHMIVPMFFLWTVSKTYFKYFLTCH